VAHMTRPVPPVTDHVPDLDPALVRIIMRCLEKDPARRYQTAEDLADALDAVLEIPSLNPWTSSVLGSQSDELPRVDALAQTLPVTAVAIQDFREMAPRRRRQSGWLAAFLMLMVVGATVAVVAARTGLISIGGPGPVAASAPGATPGAAPGQAGRDQRHWWGRPPNPPAAPAANDESPEAMTAANRRPIMVAEDGYSMRALIPERMITGPEYEITFVIWDPDGEPVTTSEMIIILIKGEDQHGFAAKPTAVAGEFRFTQSFSEPGEYILRVHSPAGGTSIQLYFDVSKTSAPVPGI